MDHADELKNIGLKATLPRLKILDIFRASPDRHLSAEDIYRLVLADNTDLGLATVYRVLSQFEQTGLLKRSQFGGSKAVYELNDHERHHGHLVCTRTGDVKEFFDAGIESRLVAIAHDMGYDLADYTITLFGRARSAEANASAGAVPLRG
jgi:Fur family ferric uptake transcriptional regulator